MRARLALLLLMLPLQVWALSLSDITDADASGGLKEALTQGASTAVAKLGRSGGFLNNPKVRIPLPEKLQKVEKILRKFGYDEEIDDLTTAMNRAAEAAVPEAKQLLIDAVKSMSVEDAKQIVKGGDDSVTQFFRGKTESNLTERFLPIVRQATDKVKLARKYDKLAGKAAKYGLLDEEDASVDGYVTRKALDGLYLIIAEQERAIRKDPLGAAGSLAKKLFGALR